MKIETKEIQKQQQLVTAAICNTKLRNVLHIAAKRYTQAQKKE